MATEIRGKLVTVLPMVSGTGSNGDWSKIEFIIETFGDYPKKVCLEAWNEKVDTICSLLPNSDLTIGYNPESKEFNSKWYTNLRAWKINVNGATNLSTPPADDIPY